MPKECNSVVMSGIVVGTPEMKHVGANGTPLLDFGFKTSRSRKTAEGWTYIPLLLSAKCWGDLAAGLAADGLESRMRVLLKGRLDMDEWESKDGSGKRRKYALTVFEARILEPDEAVAEDAEPVAYEGLAPSGRPGEEGSAGGSAEDDPDAADDMPF